MWTRTYFAGVSLGEKVGPMDSDAVPDIGQYGRDGLLVVIVSACRVLVDATRKRGSHSRA